MSCCRECVNCIEYNIGDMRCSFGLKHGSLSQRELDDEHGCKKFTKSHRKKAPPSEIKLPGERRYKGDKVAEKNQTSLF